MRAARSAGTAATTAFCVAVRLRPSAEAMLETMLGDRTSAISATKLAAMGDSPRNRAIPRRDKLPRLDVLLKQGFMIAQRGAVLATAHRDSLCRTHTDCLGRAWGIWHAASAALKRPETRCRLKVPNSREPRRQ